MLDRITTGNAKDDGREFRFWFVGEIEKWCRQNALPFDARRYGFRNTGDLEVKWGTYKKGDIRHAWASCSGSMAMSILVRGDFTFLFRDPAAPRLCREVRLCDEGDYVIWREDVEHTWRMDEDSRIITLRWPWRGQT
ncbi:MAG: hypothetical protein JSU90_07130 [Nitrospiraceae bacterium]|nr:MAG: hypothetical protein JSU90_07130 [Nitrospiraceae bacterium]